MSGELRPTKCGRQLLVWGERLEDQQCLGCRDKGWPGMCVACVWWGVEVSDGFKNDSLFTSAHRRLSNMHFITSGTIYDV